MTTLLSDAIWMAVIAAEHAHGEGAESYARDRASMARRDGDMPISEIWDQAANTLHSLHAINRDVAHRHAHPAGNRHPE